MTRGPLVARAWQQAHNFVLDRMNVGRAGRFSETGEVWTLREIARRLQTRRPVVFDVGANTGDYTRAILDVWPDATIHAFEPSPTARESWQHVPPNVTLNPLALSDMEGEAFLHADYPGSALASLTKRKVIHEDIPFVHADRVLTTTLDSYCCSHGVGHIDLLKMDVEGAELAILRGAPETIPHTRFIQFEFGGANIDTRTFFRDFWERLTPEHDLYRILARGWLPIVKYRENYEMFLTTNYIAEKRAPLGAPPSLPSAHQQTTKEVPDNGSTKIRTASDLGGADAPVDSGGSAPSVERRESTGPTRGLLITTPAGPNNYQPPYQEPPHEKTPRPAAFIIRASCECEFHLLNGADPQVVLESVLDCPKHPRGARA